MSFLKQLMVCCLMVSICIPMAIAGEKPENYCQDPASWEKWEALCEKYPHDKNIQILHALRIGLCRKVEQGDLTVPQATDIFETARKSVIQQKKAKHMAEKDNSQL
ncbi:MAG: hypothetical protein SWH61_12785 [Thermodesulfobacteriota bacterium]|nr:hypothetical protein [Thermodesulfobacteriota bacterium]